MPQAHFSSRLCLAPGYRLRCGFIGLIVLGWVHWPHFGMALEEFEPLPVLSAGLLLQPEIMTARMIAAKIDYPLENILYSEAIYEFSV